MGTLVSDGRPRWVIVGSVLLLVLGLALAGIVWYSPEGTADDGPATAFAEVGEERGFEYAANNYRQKGNSRAGVYVADVNNDGDPDVLATGGDDPVLFENTGGEFEPSERLPQINATVNSALFLDQDGDGWDDLLLFPRQSTPIFLENDAGTFDRKDAGLGDVRLTIPVAASAADYNGDGCLDVFIAQNGDWRRTIPEKELLAQEEEGFARTPDREFAKDRREQSSDGPRDNVPPPSTWAPPEDNGEPNYLLEGDCDSGTFTDVTEEAGIDGTRWSMAVSFTDFTGNGYPDIHEANDFNYDFLWVNQDGEGFERQLIPDTNRHAMSSQVADFNGDGQMDIFVTNIRVHGERGGYKGLEMVDNSGNNLLINDNGSFTSEETAFGVREGAWGWAAAATDFTNDGQVDLIHTTLHEGTSFRVNMTYPKVWERDGDRFEPVDAETVGFERMSGRGIAVLDYNGDGKEDLVVSALDGSFRLYENRGETGNWLQFAVRDDDGAFALGAEVTVRFDDGDTERVHHYVTKSRTDLLAQHTRVQHVGVGAAETVTVEVTYPDGTTRTYEDIEANQLVSLTPDGGVEAGPGGPAS